MTAEGIDRLRLDAERTTLILLCMEEAPGDHVICGPHFPEAINIFRDALDAGGDVARQHGETADLFR